MKLWKHQLGHFILLLFLLSGIFYALESFPELKEGELLGVSSKFYLLLAIIVPIIHQLYVLICWRSELYYQRISKHFGKKGFLYYKIGFAIQILCRPLTLVLVAISNADTMDIQTKLKWIITILLVIPSIYVFYSVKKYFGIDSAFGLDHFFPEEAKNRGFVKKGIFKYTSNGMYTYGFLALWIPGIIWESKAALLLALFNHLYIWVHYYFTELPDIKYIYKK